MTLDIDADVLKAAKELAAARKTTAGRVISDLARTAPARGRSSAAITRNGFELLPAGGAIVTVELVERLAADDG